MAWQSTTSTGLSRVVGLGLGQDWLVVTANATQYRQLQLKQSEGNTLDNYHLIQPMSILILNSPSHVRFCRPEPMASILPLSICCPCLEVMNLAVALHRVMHCGGQRRRVFLPGIRVYRVHRTYIEAPSRRPHYSFQGFRPVWRGHHLSLQSSQAHPNPASSRFPWPAVNQPPRLR